MRLTRRGRAAAYAALFSAAFLTGLLLAGLLLPTPDRALCAQSCNPIERHP